jgi:uncharacterized membrane protein YdfJ with MMPL/SSD domain
MSDVREEVGSRSSRRFLARIGTAAIGAVAAALVAAVVGAPSAAAAQPNHQACLGQDIRTYAQMGAGFGAFVSGLSDGGVGTEIQAHLAGLVPDEQVPNSCND